MIDAPKIAVIGLGYVGLPLALAFANKFPVIGFDINHKRIEDLKNGIDRTGEISIEQITAAEQLKFSSDPSEIAEANIFIITVPTPVTEDKQPDLQFLINASRLVATVLKKNDLVIFESTVYPGCTEEDCFPVLEQFSGLQLNRDFFGGYSPERISPGDKSRTLKEIVKVTSGSNPEAAKRVDDLYKSIINVGTYPAPSIKVAEASKSIENAQRDLNISFMNELALIFDKMGIDTNDVLAAAGTKWNFLPFKPGLVGGHCIGVDPLYLAFKAMQLGYQPKVILSGREINDRMGVFVAEKLIAMLVAKKQGNIQECKVLILGFAFKENCSDTRNTKVVDIYHSLSNVGMKIDVYDPLVNSEEILHNYGIKLAETISAEYDAVILAVAHGNFQNIDFGKFKNNGSLLFDTQGFIDRNIVDFRL